MAFDVSVGAKRLRSAAANDDVEAAQNELKNGIHVDARDGNGFTALHKATETRATNVVQILLAASADANVKDTHLLSYHCVIFLSLRQNDI